MEKTEPPQNRQNGRDFALAVSLESGLGFIGLLIAWLANISLYSQLEISRPALLRGLLATLPMLAGLVLLMQSRWSPLADLRQHVESLVRDVFYHSSWPELAMISLAAGVGEELLFRGALQPLIAGWTSPVVGVVFVGVIFGAMHAVSKTYFVLATVIGIYLGWLALAHDDLVAPITTHAIYDFVALAYVQRRVRR